jgi:hypothetical protein
MPEQVLASSTISNDDMRSAIPYDIKLNTPKHVPQITIFLVTRSFKSITCPVHAALTKERTSERSVQIEVEVSFEFEITKEKNVYVEFQLSRFRSFSTNSNGTY